ncbi:MAG: carboxymuconolactone decarboxylase family protein [Ignavibacteriaceae bacterium]|nr:carboxymuconolactone decarboxylase family protein [Ignavibacterium sp.]MCC6255942.1 carboxymuconolactone decarboxylase family protein [Ignavibacteriaceae bacterium]HMN23018.1 carboxymuconolactone decarboxylase family protein [Ignavibacteriaceae bacterium]HRN26833.1 carboxymuconolactone decarboxylase family protein [Ignavibacteriaceae bacterium]HRP93223.1 carboxymuconolactone decarboxylase family protein [Ignavibacteriaceae bacterium]
MALTETKIDFLKDLGLDENTKIPALEMMSDGETKYLRDLRVNVKNVLTSTNIQSKESYLLALSIAVNEKNDLLVKSFTEKAKELEASEAEIAETIACASMLASNNVFYRFRHFTKDTNPAYQTMPAGIKMNVMMNPVLGKELFELMSLAVSAVNGCESCVNSHEESVRKLGASDARIFDAIRLASVIRGLTLIIK